MIWVKDYTYIPQYKQVSSNQHGDRFKRITPKRLAVATISCKTDSAAELTELILLGHALDVPVHYDFSDHTAFIKIVSYETLI